MKTLFSPIHLVLGMLFCMGLFSISHAHPGRLPKIDLVPGGLIILPLTQVTQPKIFLKARRGVVIGKPKHWFAIVGIPLEYKPKQIKLTLHTSESQSILPIKLRHKHYPIRYLTIRKPRHTGSEKNFPTKNRSLKRKMRLEKFDQTLFNHFREINHVDYHFSLPVKGRMTSPFGIRRILNGRYHTRHLGVDFAAPIGSQVHATALGQVITTGYYALLGKTVLLDHGQSLMSIYCHLNKILVKKHQYVRRGQIIGTVGNTGRSTGPHLHWGVSINGTRVNPMLFIH
jgi:hypothetical protein